jgi:regulator of protease activity HflC (stomatin/prohibitin superfamily)
MFLFIVAIVLLLVALALFIVGARKPETRPAAPLIAAVVLALAVVAGIFSITYTQGAREAKVLIDASGRIVGQTTSAGFHAKAPWQHTETFNTSNQLASFINSADGEETDNAGNQRTGPYITAQDSEGVSENVSLTIQYSIDADAVGDIYKTYANEETFKTSFIANSVRQVTRDNQNGFTTKEAITNRTKVAKGLTKALESKWRGTGVHLDNVSLQEITPPKTVSNAYANAQKAQVEVQKEQANLEAQKVKAQQEVQSAQAQADANELLNKHPLSDAALKQQEIEALKNANMIVVPSGSDSILQLPGSSK